jgi:hypothetical protein
MPTTRGTPALVMPSAINFRNAVEEGVRHGHKIAAYAVHHVFRPVD